MRIGALAPHLPIRAAENLEASLNTLTMEMRQLDQQTVLIISDQAEFSSVLTGRWQAERGVPAFTLMQADLCQELDAEAFDVAIVGGVRARVLFKVLKALHETGKPGLLVCEESQAVRKIRETNPRVSVLRQTEDWLDTAVLLASEMLRRVEFGARLERVEKENAFLQRQAALGGYMLETRHTVNNALTSILGNSELLLLEAGVLSAEMRAQVETVRDMAMRMHEILRRFSSLEKELTLVEKQAAKGSKTKAHSAGAKG
jgi:signal transduction histidine kinase